MDLHEFLALVKDLMVEVERQRETNEIWEGQNQEDRLRIELRILHAILERDERLADFRRYRNIKYLI